MYQCVENELHEFEHTIFFIVVYKCIVYKLRPFCNTIIIYPCTKCGVFIFLSYTSMHIAIVLRCYNRC